MKKILTFLLLLVSSISYSQQSNTTNTNFTNGLGSSKFFNIPRGTVQPTIGVLSGSLFFHTTFGLQYYDGATWQTLGLSGAGVTSFNSRIGVVVPVIGDYSSFYVPLTRTLTINGTSQSLVSDRTWNVGTVTNLIATAGTGISVTGSPITTSGNLTITNTAPDQTVALTSGTGISATGTYPNFTITNTSPSSGGTVTNVSALTIGTTGADLSSSVATSTTTPVITLNVPTASASNRGALSSTDWTAFNGKQNQNIVNATTTTFTTATLNSTYPSAVIGQAIVCPNLTDGAVTYVKTTSTVWMNFPMGTVL